MFSHSLQPAPRPAGVRALVGAHSRPGSRGPDSGTLDGRFFMSFEALAGGSRGAQHPLAREQTAGLCSG